MGFDWLADLTHSLAGGEDAVLVTVARTQGSVPREAGATMVITASGSHQTIGGGHLEWQAIQHARHCLTNPNAQPEIIRYNLGARLGQCCGGVVWLLFETVRAETLADWQDHERAIQQGATLQRQLDNQSGESRWAPHAQSATPAVSLIIDAQLWAFSQTFERPCFAVYLYGAGHVARAVVRQLALLGADITWIDDRDEGFDGFDLDALDGAGSAPIRLNKLITDCPEETVAQAPAGTYFLIMTQSHALDFTLCEAIFRRRDYAYFGLIGSASKRATFEHRLRARGLEKSRLAEMTCPIGLPGIAGKDPASIALAVAAEIHQIRHTRQLLAQAGRARSADRHALPE